MDHEGKSPADIEKPNPAPGGPPKGQPVKLVLRGAVTLGSFGLLVWLLARQGWEEILTALYTLSLPVVLAAAGVTLISRLAVGTRWYMLLRAAHLQVGYLRCLQITFAGLFASNFLPTTIGGDVVRMGLLLQLKTGRAAAGASIVVDRLVGMAGMASALPLGAGPFLAYLGALQVTPSALALPFNKYQLMKTRQRWGERGKQVVGIWLTNPRSLILAFAWTWVHMLANAFAIWLLLHTLGSDISLSLGLGLWSVVYFITLVPISINGLGLQEISMTLVYTQVAGVAPEQAALAALMLRALQVLASLPGALYLPTALGAEPAPTQET